MDGSRQKSRDCCSTSIIESARDCREYKPPCRMMLPPPIGLVSHSKRQQPKARNAARVHASASLGGSSRQSSKGKNRPRTIPQVALQQRPYNLDILEPPEQQQPLRRDIVVSGARFLFIAGTDGSGHHFWRGALQRCPFCRDATRIHEGLMDLWYQSTDIHGPASRIVTAFREYSRLDGILWACNVFSTSALRWHMKTGLNETRCTGGMHSYPCGAPA